MISEAVDKLRQLLCLAGFCDLLLGGINLPRKPLYTHNDCEVAEEDEYKLRVNSKTKENVCMYLLIGKGQCAQKRPYWGEDRIKGKIYESNSCLNLRCSVTDATANGKRFQFVTTLHTKLFRLLRVLPVWLRSLIDDILIPGLLEKLEN